MSKSESAFRSSFHSHLDGMVYVRGSSDDWDRYADVTGDVGWSWDNMQPYIRKVVLLSLRPIQT